MTVVASAPGSSFAPHSLAVPAAPPRVLVIDPVRERRESLRAVLHHEGCEVDILDKGDGASIAMHDIKPDLIVIHADLPDKPAPVICRELKETELGRMTPIVLSGEGARADALVARGLLAGADDFLTLDGRPLELRARIRVQLRNRRDREILVRVQVERDALRREARLDPLTGVLNRRSFESTLFSQLALREPFALMFLDVDHFKSVNDKFGHDVGDVVLQAVADRMRRSVRDGDTCARFGGEEFVILARTVTSDLAIQVADRHRRAIEALLFPQLQGRQVTVSIGVAVFDPAQPDPSPESLVARADHAVYEARRAGRNRVALASASPAAELEEALPPTSMARVSSAPVSQSPAHPAASAPPPWSEEPKTLVRGTAIDDGKDNPGIERTAIFSSPPNSKSPLETHLLAQLAKTRIAVPVLPDIATEALRMANDPKIGAAELSKIVDRSPQVGGRFISLANSAFYGRGAKMLSTHAAIVRLGLGGTRDLILQIVYEQSSSGLPRYHEQVARSLHRSVLAAITARTVCWELRQRYDHAYLAGLLHDIGESRIYRILADLPVPPEGTTEVEELVRRYHARAGAEVIAAWNLPADIAETCAMHHENDENPSLHVKVTMISDKLVDIVQSPSSNGVSSSDLERLAKLGIAEGRALALIQATREVAKAM
jgi:diguanylate cyclase (GGDEF)-like protein/putative nucleotidyltransferase with HDIG domain